MPVLKRARQFLVRHVRDARDEESGVILLISVLAAATVAASIGTAILLEVSGPRADVNSVRDNGRQLEKINQAIILYAIQDANYLLPCPASGTASDGVSIACTDTTNNVGTVPWSTLGLSEADATDAYGNIIVYAMSVSGGAALEACETSGGEATGNVSTGTLTAGDTTGTASNLLYALVSHGPNGRGSFDAAGNTSQTPTSTQESENCAAGAGCTIPNANFIDTGPFTDDGGGTNHFDDEVLLANASDFQTECTNFASMNTDPLVFIDESFDGTGNFDSSSNDDLTVAGAGTAVLSGSGTVTVTEDLEISSSSVLFAPDITNLYMSIQWTPTAVGDSGGADSVRMSIVTRADILAGASISNDIFDTDTTGGTVDGGYTIRFAGSDPGGGGTITVDIVENDTGVATSLSPTVVGAAVNVDVTNPDTFELEVFDDGNQIWARITEVGDTSNQQTAYATLGDSTAAPNQVAFIHNPDTGAVSTLDDLLVAKGGIVLEIDNLSGGTLLATAANAFANLTAETTFSSEFWFYGREDNASFGGMAYQGRDNGTGNRSIFRVLTVGGDELEFNDSSGTQPSLEVATVDPSLTGAWNHAAFTCNSGVDRQLFYNGSSVAQDALACGILVGGTIGGGDIMEIQMVNSRFLVSEARTWETVRTPTEINDNFTTRASSTDSDLYFQYRFDDGFGNTTAVDSESVTNGQFDFTTGFDGTTNYVGFRTPFVSSASDVCPGFEDATDPFKCVYDGQAGGGETTATVNIPLDITEVLIKAWGGGGGAGTGTGGGGGHAEGRFTAIGADAVSGNSLLVTAAGPGQGNAGGGGGGGASAVQFSATSTTTLLIAGGGGGTGDRVLAAGGAGGGTAGEDGSGYPPTDGSGGDQTNGGAGGSGGGSAGGNADLANGADGGDGAVTGGLTAVGGTGFGDGGDSYGIDTGGGGGGLSGGGGAGHDGSFGGGAGGGSGYFDPANLTSGETNTGAGTFPGDSGDTDRGAAATGSSGASAGSPGRVVICWSSACLP